MKLSLATRIFLGYAVVLVTFGAVSIFSVTEMHRSRQEILLVAQGYPQLSQLVASIETLHKGLVGDGSRLARVYAPTIAEHVAKGRAQVAALKAGRSGSEVPFLEELERQFAELGARYAEYFAKPAGAPGEPGAARAEEDALIRLVRRLHANLEDRIRQRVLLAQEREQRTGLVIITLSVLAIGVGLVATAFSARALRPVRTLTEGATRIARGDYSAQLGVRGHDEIATLARAFDAMATSLQQREEQLRAQAEALLRAEQLAAVGRISAQVAHEVRNPLSSIGLNVELLEEAVAHARFPSEAEGREARELLAAVTREVDRLNDVTERYLRMARMPQPQLAAEDVNEVVGGVLDFAREELERSGVRVERRLADGLPRALADEGQLRQVFLNLVRNGREAMPGGGTLRVETRACPEGGEGGERGGIEVVFQDTGVGMPEAVRERIFQPFFTTKGNGTGLGLAVSRQILQAHGGAIRCDSAPGKGTTFVLRLPRA
jgi:signal transduction histidine kinase